MTLSNHGSVVTSPDTIKKEMTATLRFSCAGVMGIHRPLKSQYLRQGSWQEGIRFTEELESREERSSAGELPLGGLMGQKALMR